jgi:hypothetical protein
MIINRELIKENLEIYNKVKSEISIISEYERNEIPSYGLNQFGAADFAEFYESFLVSKGNNFAVIDTEMNWRKLKTILIQQTTDAKLKKYISKRTENQFISWLTTDPATFDKLLNGKWVRKPRQGRRRWLYGSRGELFMDSLKTCRLPIINYIINKGIDANSTHSEIEAGILVQREYAHLIKWFTTKKLSSDLIPVRELEMTKKLLTTFINTLGESNIDFRKLNIDYITNSIGDKIKSNMKVPEGTMVKALTDLKDTSGKQVITKDRFYKVDSSTITGGFVRVYIADDSTWKRHYDYKYFEDMSLHREDILKQLFGE